jgi:hypothetical protein
MNTKRGKKMMNNNMDIALLIDKLDNFVNNEQFMKNIHDINSIELACIYYLTSYTHGEDVPFYSLCNAIHRYVNANYKRIVGLGDPLFGYSSLP